jgi:hypothetical protein
MEGKGIVHQQVPTIIYSVTDDLMSPHTKKGYRKNFNHFLEVQQTNEESLLELADKSPMHIKAMIIRHIKHLTEEQKLTHGSIHTHCFSIFHFFEMNDILLNTRKVMRFLPPNKGTREDRAYTQQEIQELLLKTDDRSRAMNGR